MKVKGEKQREKKGGKVESKVKRKKEGGKKRRKQKGEGMREGNCKIENTTIERVITIRDQEKRERRQMAREDGFWTNGVEDGKARRRE